MSDHFDITLDRKLESNSDKAADGVQNCGGSSWSRVLVGADTGRRRHWSSGNKARIVVGSLLPGAKVSDVARLNGLSPKQLFARRREAYALFKEGAGTASALRAVMASVPQPQGRTGQ